MVVSDTSKPSMRSSPWMRGAPQLGFSATIWKIKSQIGLEILRPPPTRFRTLQSMAQYSLNPARCEQQLPAGREKAPPSIETRAGAPVPKTTYRVAPVLAWDVCVSRRQVVAGERGFLA